MFKTYTLKDWVRFVEAYGQPIRLGTYPPNASADDRNVLYRAVANIAPDMAAIVPEGMTIEFPDLANVQGRSEIYRDLVGYIDSQMSIVVLGQTLTTEAGERGARSLGEVHDLVRRDIEHSDGRQLAQTLRRDLIVPMVALNRGERREYPRVVIERETPPDRKLIADVLSTLVPLGLRVRTDEVRTIMGFEEPDEDDDVLESRAPPDMGDEEEEDEDDAEDKDAMARALLALARSQRPGAALDAIDLAVAQATGDWRPVMDPMIEPVLAAARDALSSGGYDAFRERLPELLSRMDGDAMARLLRNMAFSGDISSRI